MIHIYDEDVYKHSDNICLKCEYEICEDCKYYNKYYNNTNTDDKESDINNGESD